MIGATTIGVNGRRVLAAVGTTIILVTSCGGKLAPLTTPCSNGVSPVRFVTKGLPFDGRAVTAYRDVTISSLPDACGAELERAERTVLLIMYRYWGGTGTFAVKREIDVSLRHFPTGAPPTKQDQTVDATGGTVTLTRFRTSDPIRISGSYDVVFPDGVRASGDFDSPFCNRFDDCPGWNAGP